MRILIIGSNPFRSAVAELCRAAGHEVRDYSTGTFLAGTTPLEVDLLIEMHHQDAAQKQAVLETAGRLVTAAGLICSSALNASATAAGAWSGRPQQTVGCAFFPAFEQQENIVELAAGLGTSSQTLDAAVSFWSELGLIPVIVGDGVGLVRGRVICCLINEALSAVQSGLAAPEDIDTAMQLGTGYPQGPLAWGEALGFDTVLAVMNALYEEWGEDRYRPAPLLKHLVLAGRSVFP